MTTTIPNALSLEQIQGAKKGSAAPRVTARSVDEVRQAKRADIDRQWQELREREAKADEAIARASQDLQDAYAARARAIAAITKEQPEIRARFAQLQADMRELERQDKTLLGALTRVDNRLESAQTALREANLAKVAIKAEAAKLPAD